MDHMPRTRLGKWSVGLNTLFVVVIVTSILLVKGARVLSFGDRWWDVTVPIVCLLTITALIIGIRAVRTHGDRTTAVYLSIAISVCAILFGLLHSLFISD